MAISYPRSLPSQFKHAASDFKLLFNQVPVRTWGARRQITELGPELWVASYSTPVLSSADRRPIIAWLDSLRGGVGTFYGHDPEFEYPAADAPEGPISIGSPTLAGTSTANNTIDITGGAVGYVLNAGDYLAFDHPVSGGETHRALYRLLEGATLDGSGAASNLTVRPRVLSGAGTGQAVTFEKASAEMRVLAESIKYPSSDTGPGAISFDAFQVVRV